MGKWRSDKGLPSLCVYLISDHFYWDIAYWSTINDDKGLSIIFSQFYAMLCKYRHNKCSGIYKQKLHKMFKCYNFAQIRRRTNVHFCDMIGFVLNTWDCLIMSCSQTGKFSVYLVGMNLWGSKILIRIAI